MAAPVGLADILKDPAMKSDDPKNPAQHMEQLAHAAEAAERYPDMVEVMKAIVDLELAQRGGQGSTEGLSSDQRNLLSVAYKNVVGQKRSAWRQLDENAQQGGRDDTLDKDVLSAYRKRVSAELDTVCKEVLAKLNELSKQQYSREPEYAKKKMKGDEVDAHDTDGANEAKSYAECQVFYLKMIGDYYRYLTEVFSDNPEFKSQCNDFYKRAMTIAEALLEATHPTRLGLALNFSVCYYEILDNPDKACVLAKKAFDEAIEKLDSLNDVSYKDSTLIMQLLRDNLTIWNQSSQKEDPTDPNAQPEEDAVAS